MSKSQNRRTFHPSCFKRVVIALSLRMLSSIFLNQKLFLTFIFFFSFSQSKPCQKEESQNTATFLRFQQKSGVPSTPFRFLRYPRKLEDQSAPAMIFSISVPFAFTRDILYETISFLLRFKRVITYLSLLDRQQS